MSRKSSTETLIAAMRVLARDIQSGDGVANAAIAEAADRLAEQQARIAELERLIGNMSHKAELYDEACALVGTLGHMNVTNAVSALQARIAELEKSVEWWQGCTKDCGDVINDGIESRQQLRAECDRLRAKVSEPEQANSRVILDSSDHVPGATKMVTDRLRARIAELEAQAAKEPSTVAVDAGALEALRSAMSKLRAPMSRTEYAAARAGIIEAACRLLAGGGQ